MNVILILIGIYIVLSILSYILLKILKLGLPNILSNILTKINTFNIKLLISIRGFFINLVKQAPVLLRNILKGIKNIFINIKACFARFIKAPLSFKISHFIMGYGNLINKQYGRFIIFFLLEFSYFYIMITNPTINNTPIGFASIPNFFTLGSFTGSEVKSADNSFLMLLFGLVVIMLTVFIIALYFASLKSSLSAINAIKENKPLPTFKDDLKSLTTTNFHRFLLTPAVVGVLIFTILPTVLMIVIAFTNYDRDHSGADQLFDWNFTAALGEIFNGASEIGSRFIPVLIWTLIWAIIATFSCYILGILLALLINKKGIKFKKGFRTIFILTIAIPQFVSLLVMRQLLDVTGPVNSLLTSIGMSPIDFLGQVTDNATGFWDVWGPRITILVVNLWIGIPYTMLQTTGVLMNIPKDLYEAAEIDGANKREIFRKITLPYILFITTPALITSFMGNITSFNIIYLLTGGGPNVGMYYAGSTDLLVTWLFKLTVDQMQYNAGAVISILTFVIMAIGTLITYRRSKSYKDEEAFQ